VVTKKAVVRRSLGLVLLAVVAGGASAGAEPPLDVDRWHVELPEGEDDTVERRFELGLYPGIAGVGGAPNLVSWEASAYLSIGDNRSFRLFVGYGEFFNDTATTEIYTIGWGGVRRLQSAAPQRGFHGKFLRYRRWEHRDHGVHHGLSVGVENGVGHFALVVEIGAARSDRNHWLATAQVAVKIALPVVIPLGR
jgi:hypothetical protein